MERLHRPVMPAEVVDFINLKAGGVYADLTFGEGGHSSLFLTQGISKLYATDRDPNAVERALRKPEWQKEERLKLFHSTFSEFPNLVSGVLFDGMLMDLGVSTAQLLEGERGFSLFSEGPLDMRMNPSEGETLAEILEEISEEDLANALHKYTDLEKSRSTARRVVNFFKEGKLKTTTDLANLMGKARPGRSHPASALFLALRMLVNQEMEQVEITVPRLIPLLKKGGRLVVLTFHSNEDRVVKKLFKILSGGCACDLDICNCPRVSIVKNLTPKPLIPTDLEIRQNPRARSTKLRAIEKL